MFSRQICWRSEVVPLKTNAMQKNENDAYFIKGCVAPFHILWCSCINRRKFRSQTSDNMDRWKAEQGRGRKKRKIRRKKSRRERVRRKKMQMREKVGKSRNTVFFQWFGAPDSRKVGSLKQRVRSQLARWEIKNRTPLWREAHFQVKMYKTHHVRTSFGSCDVEKMHAVVARSIFPSQKCKKLRGTEHFWTFRCRFAWQAQGIVHLVKSEQNMKVLSQFPKRWQAWDIWRGSAKMHFPWQAQYKRHLHRSC